MSARTTREQDVATRPSQAALRPEDVCRALESVVELGDSFIVLHSGLRAFGLPGADLKAPLLNTLRNLQARGHTLALPTFTLSFLGGEPYHHEGSPSEVGVLGQWFLEQDGVRRSSHPVYSFAVAGPRADELLACECRTTFGEESPFGLFHRADARFVMLGCSWESCTQFHFCEEAAGVPYRFFKSFEGRADFGGGVQDAVVEMYVRDLEIDAINAFSPLVESLRGDGMVKGECVGAGRIESLSCQALVARVEAALRRDALALVSDAAAVRHRIDEKRNRGEAASHVRG